MRRYANDRTYTWNNDTAYLAGLFASDGCLSKDGRHLFMVSKDEEIIAATQRITSKSAKPTIKSGQFGTTAYHFQFSDVALYDFFLEAGITPAKSKTIGVVSVPDLYYADFLRGYFDGDGTAYGYRDIRWKNSFMYYVGFVSASQEFLYWLQAQNRRLMQATSGKINPGIRASVLLYAKADSYKLFNAMYTPPPLFRLTRKYTKLRDFIIDDPHAKITPDARVLESVDRLA